MFINNDKIHSLGYPSGEALLLIKIVLHELILHMMIKTNSFFTQSFRYYEYLIHFLFIL